MKRLGFGLAFYCRQSKIGKKGTAPIEMSVTINGKRTFLALPRKMFPKDFEKDMGSRRGNATKEFCKSYERLVDDAVNSILESRKAVTPQAIKNYLINGCDKDCMLSTLFKEYLNLLKAKDTTICTYRKYEMAFERFLKQVGDKDIQEVSSIELETYMANCSREYNQGTVRSYCLKLKSVFIQAKRNGILKNDVWDGIKIKNPTPIIDLLTEDEYEMLKNKRFDIPRLERMKKICLLAASSGMAYCDIQDLKPSDIQYEDGKMYVKKERLKTGVEYISVILEDGKKVIDEMDGDFSPIRLSNQKCNVYIHTMMDLLGIKKKITFHSFRHFYITHLMRMGLPPQIVQKAAGHSKLSMTQRYTHLLKDDVLNAFKQ